MTDDPGMASPLRVLMVSTTYPRDLSDWRGLFIRHLVDALSRRRTLTKPSRGLTSMRSMRPTLTESPGDHPGRDSGGAASSAA